MPNIRIGIMGASLGTRNRGVSALSASLIRLFDEACPGATPILLIGNSTSQPYQLRTESHAPRAIPVANFRMSPRSRISEHLLWILLCSFVYRTCPCEAIRNVVRKLCPWISTAESLDLVGDIRGGDSFSDIYGLERFITGSLPVIAIIWVRGSVVSLPQTYGPFTHPIARTLARYILRHSSHVLARDAASSAAAREMLGGLGNVHFCPDVALTLPARRPQKLDVSTPIKEVTGRVLVGINVNGLMLNGGYTRNNMFGLSLDYADFLIRSISTLLLDPCAHVLMIPHTFAPPGDVESDPEGCTFVWSRLPSELKTRVSLLKGTYDQSEVKWIIGQSDFFIGSRMHACIAALSQGIPTIGVAYSRKFYGVFESIGVGHWVIDGCAESTQGAITRVHSLYKSRQTESKFIEPRIWSAQRTIRARFYSLVTELIPTGNATGETSTSSNGIAAA